MSVSLQKGQKISLTKGNEGLSKVIIGLGWDEAAKSKGGLLGGLCGSLGSFCIYGHSYFEFVIGNLFRMHTVSLLVCHLCKVLYGNFIINTCLYCTATL